MTEGNDIVNTPKVIDYKLETGKSITSIKRRTKTLIEDGWRPLGGASTYLNEKTMIVFTQTLVLYERIENATEYDIISGVSLASLAEKVKARIADDWTPSGSGFVFRSEPGDFIFCQTIIR